jgi:hypothetical protein
VPSRIPKERIKQLEELRKYILMENASFGHSKLTLHHSHGFVKAGDYTSDAYVKEATRLWRQTWVLPIIDKLLAWGKNEPEPEDSE